MDSADAVSASRRFKADQDSLAAYSRNATPHFLAAVHRTSIMSGWSVGGGMFGNFDSCLREEECRVRQ